MSERHPPEPSGAPAALEGCFEAIDRCLRLMDRIEQESADRREPLFGVFGPHLRHCLDHFTCLVRGIGTAEVDYDARDRDERLERDPEYFRETLRAARRQLESLGPGDLRKPLKVRQAAAPDGRESVSSSNLERELVFVSGHTIHHVAIMQLLAREHGVRVPDELGVAFSTARYRRSQGTTSKG